MSNPAIARILREAGAGESSGGETPPATPKFKFGDKEFTEKEAQDLFTKLETERLQAVEREKKASDEARTVRGRVKSVFDETASDRADAARALFTDLGFKPEEVEEWVSNMNGSNEETDKKGSSKGGIDPNDLSELKAGQQALNESTKNLLREQMKGWSRSSTDNTLTQHDGLAKLLSAAERLQGKENLSKTRAALTARLQERGLKLVVQQMETGREAPSAELFEKAFKIAADELVGEYSAVIGDASSLGRSSETATRFDPFKDRKPAELPKYKPGMDRGTLISAATDYVRDQLLSAEKETGGGVGSKA